jgi:hypothetical protein
LDIIWGLHEYSGVIAIKGVLLLLFLFSDGTFVPFTLKGNIASGAVASSGIVGITIVLYTVCLTWMERTIRSYRRIQVLTP